MTSDYSPLLAQYLDLLAQASTRAPVLDLACGRGRNGLFLVENRVPVIFADADEQALGSVREALDADPIARQEASARLWQVDLELPGSQPFGDRMFGAILVYRYLHRPLFDAIKRATCPGGVVIYETFTVDQPQFGRPTNPDYLLRHGELSGVFETWDILHSFEGVIDSRQSGTSPQAVARIVARKPEA
jgi:tellurite methyltransferase